MPERRLTTWRVATGFMRTRSGCGVLSVPAGAPVISLGTSSSRRERADATHHRPPERQDRRDGRADAGKNAWSLPDEPTPCFRTKRRGSSSRARSDPQDEGKALHPSLLWHRPLMWNVGSLGRGADRIWLKSQAAKRRRLVDRTDSAFTPAVEASTDVRNRHRSGNRQ